MSDTQQTVGPRVCVVGAGAIGGWIAARLALAGERTSVLARGATLAHVKQSGIELVSGGVSTSASVTASANAAELGPQDVVIIAVKAQALPTLAESLTPLLHDTTVVLPAINGLPWWFFLPGGIVQSGLRLRAVDPSGATEAAIGLQHVVGLSVFASSSSPAPGVVHHASGTKLVLGEPAGGPSARVRELAERFERAGFDVQASDNVRLAMWNKLLGNACFNPVSVLTRMYSDEMIADPGLYRLFMNMMSETLAVGDSLGLRLPTTAADRIAVTKNLGHIKSSSLQDLEAGRSIEVDGILGALVEAAEAAGVPVPTLDGVLALTRIAARAASAVRVETTAD